MTVLSGRAFDQSDWDGGNFELLRPDARRALAIADEELWRSGRRPGFLEHLVIGLASAEGPAKELLSGFSIDADTARANLGIERRMRSPVSVIRPMLHHWRVGFAIKLAFQIARTLSSDSVGGEHLLLAILLDGEAPAADMLEQVGARLEPVCQRLGVDVQVVRASPRPLRFE
jgi:ATP-dependent Clp protease ATP-binding subunit ClpA